MIFPVWTMLALGVSAAPRISGVPQSGDSQKTADDQNNSKEDLALTAKIRKALMDDKGLSIQARNVKIITQHGAVTLRGSVKSEGEKDAVAAKAREIAGAGMVSDSLTVSLPKTN
jgi:hyperosmotically inducible protein